MTRDRLCLSSGEVVAGSCRIRRGHSKIPVGEYAAVSVICVSLGPHPPLGPVADATVHQGANVTERGRNSSVCLLLMGRNTSVLLSAPNPLP